LISAFQAVILAHHLLIDIHPPVTEKRALDAIVVLAVFNFYQVC